MLRRIATLVLILLALGFFLLHRFYETTTVTRSPISAPLKRSSNNAIMADEFLILMDVGDEERLPDVLSEFDLRVISPLGEWVHVARNSAGDSRKVVELSSKKAVENARLAGLIQSHTAVHSAHLNYVELTDSMVACMPSLEFAKDDQGDEDGIIPKDPFYYRQWHLSKEHGVNMPGAWALTTGDPHIVIALVDRNFFFGSPDLSPKNCTTRRYYHEHITDYFQRAIARDPNDTSTHGTDVLSVIAPCTDNDIGISGIDWHAQIFAVDSEADRSFSARMLGILWAAGIDVCTSGITPCKKDLDLQKNLHPANIINTSFGFAERYLRDPPYGPVLDIIGQINRQGRAIVASVGNEGSFADRRLPGAAGGVISVGASNEHKQSSSFSNFGRTVDVLAPGENIFTIRNDVAVLLNGTSFSAPIVSGIASLMLAVNPKLSWKHIEYILKETSTPISCQDYCPHTMAPGAQEACQKYCCDQDRSICARGIVDAQKALEMAKDATFLLPLIDVDDYFIALSDDNGLRGEIQIKNYGKVPAKVKMKPTDKHLRMSPAVVMVKAMDESGRPGISGARVFYDVEPKHHVVASLILIGSSDKAEARGDQIEAIVEIVPDPKKSNNSHKKIFRELLPRR